MISTTNTPNRSLLITGVSSGIGLATTRQLLKQNITIIGVGRHAEETNKDAANYIGCNFDLGRINDIPNWINTLSNQHQDAFNHLSGIICCAGQGRFGSLEKFSHQQIRDLMDINFTSHACLVRELLPELKQRAIQDPLGAHLIFIGSEAALQGGRRGAIYSASKFALRGFSQSLREECNRSNIGVSLINPGMVRTAFFNPLNFGPGLEPDNAILPEDVAETISMILGMRAGTVIDEINLSPLKKVIQFDQGPSGKKKT